MGGVEHHRPAGRRHDRQGAHVGDQRVVAEAGAALADQDLARRRAARALGHHVGHVPGRQELALLDVDRPAGRGRGGQKVGLPAQEGRDLEHVDRLGHRPALVGSHGRRSSPGSRSARGPRPGLAGPCPGRGRAGCRRWCGWPCRRSSCRSARCRARAAISTSAAAVSSACVAALDRAGPGDQDQRQVVADPERRRCATCADHSAAHLRPAATARRAASMNEANSGCGCERLGLQLGVELHADEPGMVRQLDDLGQQAVRRHAGEDHARGCSSCWR